MILTLGKEQMEIADEMTIRQYQNIIKNEEIYKIDASHLLAMYLNKPINVIKNLPVENVNFIESYITSVLTKDLDGDSLWDRFEFEGVQYGLENDWGKLAWGAWCDFQILSAENIIDNIAHIMAILYRPVISTKKNKYKIQPYKSEEIDDRKDDFLELPVKYWLGAANFFFLMSAQYTNNIKSSLELKNKQMERMMLGWKILPKWLQKKLPLDSISL